MFHLIIRIEFLNLSFAVDA